MTRVILDAGPDTAARNEALMPVATGSVARECKVQLPLNRSILRIRSRPCKCYSWGGSTRRTRVGECVAKTRGKLNLPVAAALGRSTEFSHLLANASPEERHLALALAAQYGQVKIVEALLDVGEDPNRYNPSGGHSHGTPLHQAAGAGHESVVRLLIERGARPDLRDVLWHGTPADWAGHEGKNRD